METDKNSSDFRSFQEFVEAVERPEPQLPPPLGDCVKLLGFLDQFATGVSLAADPCTGLQENNHAGESPITVSGQRIREPSNEEAASLSLVSTDSGR